MILSRTEVFGDERGRGEKQKFHPASGHRLQRELALNEPLLRLVARDEINAPVEVPETIPIFDRVPRPFIVKTDYSLKKIAYAPACQHAGGEDVDHLSTHGRHGDGQVGVESRYACHQALAKTA